VRLRRGLLLALALPVPRQEFVDPLGGLILQSRQDVCEPGLRIDVVELGGFDEGVDGGGAAAAVFEVKQSGVDLKPPGTVFPFCQVSGGAVGIEPTLLRGTAF
jgi:hypothetical protein